MALSSPGELQSLLAPHFAEATSLLEIPSASPSRSDEWERLLAMAALCLAGMTVAAPPPRVRHERDWACEAVGPATSKIVAVCMRDAHVNFTSTSRMESMFVCADAVRSQQAPFSSRASRLFEPRSS